MTQEEFWQQLQTLRSEAKSVAAKKSALKKEYLNSLSYKKGDKVMIKDVGECWLKEIALSEDIYNKLDVSVFFKKLDGEPSKRYHWLGYIDINDIQRV